MGGNISTQINRVTQILKNVTENSCAINQDIQQDISGLDIVLNKSKCGDITIANRASLGGSCDLGAMASSLAQASTEMTAEQVSALNLSFNADTKVSERTSVIENVLKNKCGAEQSIRQNIEDVKITLNEAECDTINLLNSANAQVACAAKTVIDSIDTAEMKATSKQEAKPLLSIGVMLGGIGIIITVVVLALIVNAVMKNQKKKKAKQQAQQQAQARQQAELRARASSSQQLGGGADWELNTKNVPWVVLLIGTLVWYAKMTEPKK
jgi:large-conductance mechanosensitive channel